MMQPEAKVSRKIMDAIRKRGGWCYKVWGNAMTPSGIPDIVGVYRGFFIGCETKMPGNTTSEIQNYRIKRIRMSDGLVVVAYSVADVLQMLDHIDIYHLVSDNQQAHDFPCVYLGETT